MPSVAVCRTAGTVLAFECLSQALLAIRSTQVVHCSLVKGCRSERWAGANLRQTMHSKTRFRDWAVAVIGTMFVVMGIVILPTDRNVGITTIALFGVCATVSIGTLVRRFRYARLSVHSVQVVGGAKIRPSRFRMAVFGVTLLSLGAVLLVFGGPAPSTIWFCYWVIAGTGILLLVGLVLGVVPSEFLEFTPAGLVFGYRGWSVLLPWDRIARISAGETHNNPALFVWLDCPEDFKVTPEIRHAKFVQYVQRCRAWIGSDISILTTHYDVELPVLVGAINRYLEDHEARAELVPKVMMGLT